MKKRTIPVVVGAVLALSAVLAVPARAGEAGRTPVRPACVPEGVEAWLVLPAPSVSIERARKLVETIEPNFALLAEMTLKGQLAKQGGDAVDGARPVVAVFALGKKPTYALALPLKPESDAAKALEARFGKPAKTDDGISTFLEVQEGALPDKEVYAAAKDGRLVLGDSLELVKLLAAAAAPGAGAFAKDLDAVAGIDVKLVATRHREDLDGFLKKMETEPEKLLPGGNAPPNLKDIGRLYAAAIRSAVKECEQAGVELRLADDEASLSALVMPVPDGRMAAAAAKLSRAKPPAAEFMPAGALFTVAGTLPRDAADILAEISKEMLTALPDLDPQVKKDIEAMTAAWKELSGQVDGTISEALVRRAGGLCGLMHFGGVKEAPAARAAFAKMIRSGLSENLMKQWAGGAKIKADFKENHRQSGDTGVDRLSVEFGAGENDGDQAAMIAEIQRQMLERIYGTPLIYEIGVSGKGVFTTFGKEAPAALDELLERAAKGAAGGQVLAAVRAKAPEGAFLIGELSILEYWRLVMEMMAGMAPMPALDIGQRPGKPATFWWQAAGDGGMTMRMNMPLEPIKTIADAVRKMQQQMQQQRQLPPAPVPGDPGAEQF